MKKKQFSANQISSILKEFDNGRSIEELVRSYGISRATLYNWRKKYGGMEASEMKKVKELEAENTRLKRMYANLAMELDVAKYIIEKKALKPCHKRDMVEQLRIEYPQSVSKACRILKMSRSVLHYKSIKDDNFLLRLWDH